MNDPDHREKHNKDIRIYRRLRKGNLRKEATALTALLIKAYPPTTQRITISTRRACRALGLQ